MRTGELNTRAMAKRRNVQCCFRRSARRDGANLLPRGGDQIRYSIKD